MREGEKTESARRLRKDMSRAEVIVWSLLRRDGLGAKFRRQHPIGPYIADFACVATKLVVEVDGATHWTADQLAHDAARTRYLNANGWKVLRVTNTDVYENADGVFLAIQHALQSSPACGGSGPAGAEGGRHG